MGGNRDVQSFLLRIRGYTDKSMAGLLKEAMVERLK
jgi:hypothetical protein